jgi:hypothetical protein
MSRTVKVSESRRVTTPLSFTFSPLATERAPAVAVVSWAKAIETEKDDRKTASMREENILTFGIAINNLSFSSEVYRSRKRDRDVVVSDEHLN